MIEYLTLSNIRRIQPIVRLVMESFHNSILNLFLLLLLTQLTRLVSGLPPSYQGSNSRLTVWTLSEKLRNQNCTKLNIQTTKRKKTWATLASHSPAPLSRVCSFPWNIWHFLCQEVSWRRYFTFWWLLAWLESFDIQQEVLEDHGPSPPCHSCYLAASVGLAWARNH